MISSVHPENEEEKTYEKPSDRKWNKSFVFKNVQKNQNCFFFLYYIFNLPLKKNTKTISSPAYHLVVVDVVVKW